ncbi:MAG: cation:proton antiporter [Muricomes sp.]
MTLVRGESLINDASGLVAFNYAITAVMAGYFSLREAAGNLIYIFLVGAASGIILTLLADLLQFRLRKSGINDTVFNSLLTTFSFLSVSTSLQNIFSMPQVLLRW